MSDAFIPFSRPSVTDEEVGAVVDVLRSGWITTGPKNAELEETVARSVGATHCVAVCSATAGMHLALMAAGVGRDDEVITPSMTWVSTINLIELLGAKPVFVDVDRDTLMTDVDRVQAAITSRTKAIVPVHFAGAALDLDPLYELAEARGIALIEDAAHCAGTRYRGRPIGARGIAILSFQAIKNVTCAEGGMVCLADGKLAERVRRLKFHGLGMDAFDRQMQGRAPQSEVIEPGLKYNLPDMNAAMALVQFRRLGHNNARRSAIAARYLRDLADIDGVLPLKQPSHPFDHAWHLFAVRIDPDGCGMDRDRFLVDMKERGVGVGVHFRAAHVQRYYRARYPDVTLPDTEWNSSRICSLPLFPDLSDEQLNRVIATIRAVLGAKG